MIKIADDCRDNAANMLYSYGAFLGWVGNIRYYLFDGKAWSISGGTVSCSDDSLETDGIVRRTKMLKMNDAQRQIRNNVRNFLLTATLPELQKELAISNERGDKFRAECVQELIDETRTEESALSKTAV